jgi:transcriptional regulator with GAF, ATPase, and Fis domain
MIEDGKFREDLYFRLKVFPIPIPPLRERKGDMPSLVQYFVQKKSREMGLADIPSVAPDGLTRLIAYPWPGNVRELENAVERALILSKGNPLAFNDIKVPLKSEQHLELAGASECHPEFEDEAALALDTVVSAHIRRVLTMTGGKVGGKGGAAQLLHIDASTLRKRMRKLGIPFGRKAKRPGGSSG